MKLIDILNNNTDSSLSKEELEVLKREQYLISDNTPSRIINNKQYTEWLSKKHPQSLSEYYLKNGIYEIDGNNYRAFAYNKNLLKEALKCNYNKTISCLFKYGVKINGIEELKDIFLSNNYLIDSEGKDDIFVFNNPYLVIISLLNNYDYTLNLLKKDNGFNIDENNLDEFINIFKANNFVLDPSSLQLAKNYHDLFRISLKNDPIKTLNTRIYEVLDSIKDDEDLYIEFLILLDEQLSKENNKNNIKEMVYAINFEKELLFSNLESKDKYTNFLSNIDGSDLVLSLNDREKERLYSILKDINFNISNYKGLAKVGFEFYLTSLENDLEGTLNVINEKYKEWDEEYIYDFSSHDLSEFEYEKYKEIIKNNLDVFINSDIPYIDSKALKIISEIDINLAASILEGRSENELRVMVNAKDAKFILDKILENQDKLDHKPLNKDIYYRLTDLIVNTMEDNSKEYKTILKCVNEGILNINILPTRYFKYENFLKGLNIDKDSKQLIKRLFSYSYSYKKEDEELLLGMLNTGLSLEEYLVTLKDKIRSELSLNEMLLIKLYGQKILSNNQLDGYSFEVFDYPNNPYVYGVQNDKNVYLFNGHNRSVYEMIKTIHHEVNHAIQFKNIEECNFKEDKDINCYAKDELLKDILGDSYYEENYDYISHEFDTEFKAKLLTDALFNENKQNLEDIENDLKYRHQNERKDNKEDYYHLDELFIRSLNEIKITNTLIEMVNKKYSSLTYEYEFSLKGVKEYSIEELVKRYKEANEGEKEKYLVIFKNKIDPNRNKNHKDNLKKLSNLLNEDEFSKLDSSEISVIKKECDKYLTYLDECFDRISKIFSKKKTKSK